MLASLTLLLSAVTGAAALATPPASQSATTRGCPNDCSLRGACVKRAGALACACYPGYAGSNCSERACPNECSGHGTCDEEGRCQCDASHTGSDCSLRTCPNGCSGVGVCDVVTDTVLCRQILHGQRAMLRLVWTTCA